MTSNNTPKILKRPVPRYVLNRKAEIDAKLNAVMGEWWQFVVDFAGLTDVDLNRFQLWFTWDDQPKPTYEILTLADFERRQRLEAARQQAAGAVPGSQLPPAPAAKADPRPKRGEKVLRLPADALG